MTRDFHVDPDAASNVIRLADPALESIDAVYEAMAEGLDCGDFEEETRDRILRVLWALAATSKMIVDAMASDAPKIERMSE